VVHVRIAGERAILGGQAVTVARGELLAERIAPRVSPAIRPAVSPPLA
jgi:hypothetical protein